MGKYHAVLCRSRSAHDYRARGTAARGVALIRGKDAPLLLETHMHIKPAATRRSSRRWDSRGVSLSQPTLGDVRVCVLFKRDRDGRAQPLELFVTRTELETLLDKCRNFEERQSGSCNFPSTMGIADGADTS